MGFFLRVFGAIVFGAFSMGQAMSFAPEYSKSQLASARVFDLIDSKPSIDTTSDEGAKPARLHTSNKFHFK